MRSNVVGLVAAALLASVGIANAKSPVKLTDGQLDDITAGASPTSASLAASVATTGALNFAGRLARQWLQTWRPWQMSVRLARQSVPTWGLRQLSIIWWRLARQQPSLPPRPNGSAEEDGQGKARMKRSTPRSQSSSIG
jgi:hypothetical protein